MRRGQTIPQPRRDEIARAAFRIFESTGCCRARALEEIADRFDVSQPTARNLLGRGRTLVECEAAGVPPP